METSPVLRRLASSSRSPNSTLSLCSVEAGAENAPVLRNTTFCDYLRFVSNCCDKPARRLCVVEVARGRRPRPPLVKLFLQLFTEPPTQRGRDQRYRMSSQCIILTLFFSPTAAFASVKAPSVLERWQNIFGGGEGKNTRAARPHKSHFFQPRCCFSKATASPTCSYIFFFFFSSAASLAAPCQSARLRGCTVSPEREAINLL